MEVNRYDQASRYLAKLDPIGLLCWLLRWPREEVRFRGWLDTRTLPFPGDPDRTCDTVAWLSDIDPALEWALALEFALEPDPEQFGRLLEYLGRLWREKRPTDAIGEHFQVGAIVVNLTGRGRTSKAMKLRRSRVKTHLGVEERNLAYESAAKVLDGIVAGLLTPCLLALIPAMRGGDKPRIIKRWLELAGAEQSSKRRADYGGLALVFAEAAGRKEVWKRALEGWNMVESPQVQEWMAQAVAKMLLRVLANRFSPLPADLVRRIETTTDLPRLESWVDLAMQAESLEAFRRSASS